MGAMVSQITSITSIYSTVYPGADLRKHQSSASLAFVQGIHRWPVNSAHKRPVTGKMFPFDDVFMNMACEKSVAGLPAIKSQVGARLINRLEYHIFGIEPRWCWRCSKRYCETCSIHPNLLVGLYWKFDTTEWNYNPFTGIDKGPLFNMDEFSSEEWNMTIKALGEIIYQLLNFNGNG